MIVWQDEQHEGGGSGALPAAGLPYWSAPCQTSRNQNRQEQGDLDLNRTCIAMLGWDGMGPCGAHMKIIKKYIY
jgi:hypothetical protein